MVPWHYHGVTNHKKPHGIAMETEQVVTSGSASRRRSAVYISRPLTTNIDANTVSLLTTVVPAL